MKPKNVLILLGIPVGYILALLGGKFINAHFTGNWKWALGIGWALILVAILIILMTKYLDDEILEQR